MRRKVLQEFGEVCMDKRGERKGWNRHSRQENSMCQGTGAEIGIAGPGGENTSLAGPVSPQQDT